MPSTAVGSATPALLAATLPVSANALGQHSLTFDLMRIVLHSIQIGCEDLQQARPNPCLIPSIGRSSRAQGIAGIARSCWFSLRNMVGAGFKRQCSEHLSNGGHDAKRSL